MYRSRRSLYACAAVLLLASCSSAGSANLPASPISRDSVDTAATQTERDDAHVRILSGLALTIQNGRASFAIANDRPVYAASGDQTLVVPSFTLDTCPLYQHATPCPTATPSPTPGPVALALPLAQRQPNQGANYYILVRALPRGVRSAVTGPGIAAGQALVFPASNAPLVLSSGVSYRFLLAQTNGTIPTPTPSPTPTPVPNLCPNFAGKVPPVAQPVSTPPAVIVSSPPLNFISDYDFEETPIDQFTCGPNQMIYHGAGLGGAWGTFDPVMSAMRNLPTVTAVPASLALQITAQDRVDNLYATAVGATQPVVYQMSDDGTRQAHVVMPAGFNNDAPLAEGTDGNVYGTGNTQAGSNVYQISPALAVTAFKAPAACSGPWRLLAGSDGNLWFLDAGCGLVKMTTGGAFSVVASHIGFDSSGFHPTAFGEGPDGAYYVAVAGALQRVEPQNGTMTTIGLPAEASVVSGIVAGKDERLWLSASGGSLTGVMARLDLTSGAMVEWPTTVSSPNVSVGGAPTNPSFLVIGPDGNIFGTNTGRLDRGSAGLSQFSTVMKLDASFAGI